MSDAHQSLRNAIGRVLSARRQRCYVHFARDMISHVGAAQRQLVTAAIRQIFTVDSRQAARVKLGEVVQQLEAPAPKLARLLEGTERTPSTSTTSEGALGEAAHDELVGVARSRDRPALRHADVLAANALARALHVSFRPGRNFAADAFLDEDARAGFHPDDLRTTMTHAVALLHGSEGPGADTTRLAELVSELEAGSAEFRELWARHDVRRKTAGVKRFIHPVLGEIRLDYNAFVVSGAPDQTLVVCHATPATEDERKLVRLAAIAQA